ncbi:unnamed protein product [Triticum turgidum subsp. durum]|uniref:Uncharacterized protein n=1 Tax=Triticum turgidum subsp. durum TaxID=4567 RepID=A0A9R1NN92_TRITD|nr:unnamed protein product [Triticum turgidum subsp. durum]
MPGFRAQADQLTTMSSSMKTVSLPMGCSCSPTTCATHTLDVLALSLLVPPAYYAHLAAFRARYYDEPSEGSDSASIVSGGTRESAATGAGAAGPPGTYRRLPRIRDNVKDVMFYC